MRSGEINLNSGGICLDDGVHHNDLFIASVGWPLVRNVTPPGEWRKWYYRPPGLAPETAFAIRTVSKHIQGLIAKRVIKREEGTGRPGMTSRYVFLFNSLALGDVAGDVAGIATPCSRKQRRHDAEPAGGTEKSSNHEDKPLPLTPSRREGESSRSCVCDGDGMVYVTSRLHRGRHEDLGPPSFETDVRSVWTFFCSCRKGRARRSKANDSMMQIIELPLPAGFQVHSTSVYGRLEDVVA